ncbi:hypothetical protein LAZ67_17001077 [Cordylochernes scorpioides]|uniref:Mos1 transposase HTH domain-containing protein n=1 Tax=Cordylochernes scorpioides TaxID=51811 RepID=A0ABY6LF74_9ARAC|nr:hypothetical protein LAZ67_17001077 [Cordylochernes scorpioides]
MEQKLKQRICIELCVKLEISATETFEMLNKVFPNDSPKRTTVFEWHSRFKAGRISIEDEPRQGRPKCISKTTIGRIVTKDLKVKKTPAKFIPRFLTNEQKLCRLATCENMLEMTRTDPEWKDKIITGDETWVYDYDPETKRQYAEWRGQGELRPKKSRIFKSRNKVLLVAFLDNKGIVHHEYLPAGQTVIKEMYLDILRHLREAIRKKMPEKWPNEIIPQPPYSPDIAPNDFFLFPKLKAVLKGRHFDTRDDIIEKSLLALKIIPKELYKNCFDNLGKRWRCQPRRADILPIMETYGLNIDINTISNEETDATYFSKKWVVAFKLGRTSTEDEHRPGRPVESVTQENIDKIHDLAMLDRGMTVRQIEKTLGIPKTTADRIMREYLGLRKLSSRWVHKLLTLDQKAVRRKLSSDNLALFEVNSEEFVNRFVTMEETWTHHFTPESKQQSMKWRHSGSPPPKKAKTVPSAGKVMVSVFWDSEGVLLLDFLKKGQTITGNYYANLVKQLREAIKEKRRGMLSRKIVYHQDNAPSHRSLQAMAAIYDSGFELLPRAPYSPDLATSDFHLYFLI